MRPANLNQPGDRGACLAVHGDVVAHLALLRRTPPVDLHAERVTASRFASPGGGPGYARMLAHLGPAGYDALCEDSLRRKDEALAEASLARAYAPTKDRETYRDYPAPRGKRRRK